ncbi:MAG: hypothetical protein J7496_05030 [Novosphingobium sp.]|nr:hypothetical protein [Novosphingobium sp.]
MSHNGVSSGEICMYGGCFFSPPLSPVQQRVQSHFGELLKLGGVAILYGAAGSGLTTILVETYGEILRSQHKYPALLQLTPEKYGRETSRSGEAADLYRAIGDAFWDNDWILIDSNREVISDLALMEIVAHELERHPKDQKHVALALQDAPSLQAAANALFGKCAFARMEDPSVEDYAAVLEVCLGPENVGSIDVPRLYDTTRGGISAYSLSEMCASALAWGHSQPSTDLLIELSRVRGQLAGVTVALGELREKIGGKHGDLGRLLRLPTKPASSSIAAAN